MSKKNLNISYNRESEVLSVEVSSAKSVDSDIHGNVVIDYGKKGEVIRVNFYRVNFDAFKENARRVKQLARRAPISVSVP